MSKKDFTSNPAFNFIDAPEGSKPATSSTGTETKSYRLNLLLKKSTAESIKKIAYMQQTSVNDTINRLLEEYIAANADSLTQYKKTFNE